MKPIFLNLFMKKLSRERILPIISASVSWLILGTAVSGCACFAKMSDQQKDSGQPLFNPPVGTQLTGDSSAGKADRICQILYFCDFAAN